MNLILSPIKIDGEMLETGDLAELETEAAAKMPWAHRAISAKEAADLRNGGVPASLSHPAIADDQKHVVKAALKAAEKGAASKATAPAKPAAPPAPPKEPPAPPAK